MEYSVCCAGHRRRSHEGAVFVLHDEELVLCEQNMTEFNYVSEVGQQTRFALDYITRAFMNTII